MTPTHENSLTQYVLFAALSFILCFYVVNADDSNELTCFHVKSAVDYKGTIYFIDGTKYIKTDKEFKEEGHGELKDEFLRAPDDISAAVVFSSDDYLYFFKDDAYYYYSFGFVHGNDPINGYFTPQIISNGVDAAGNLDGVTYFFRGCLYSTANDDEAKSMSSLGLPCDVDAAWGVDGNMYVSKGDDYWILAKDGLIFDAPKKLSELVSVESPTVMCTTEDLKDPFEARVEAEMQYEKENNCIILDAAIHWEGTVYLFNAGEYMTLDKDGNEESIHDNIRWGGLPSHIDAGIVYLPNESTYFFRGTSYFKYWFGISLGPNSNDKWGPFFEEGIDAAGNHGGISYFFKGCEMAALDENDKATVSKTDDAGLPCDIDAAFSWNGALHVVKRNQVWIWNDSDDKAKEPEDLSSVVSLTNWDVCPL